MRVLIIDEDTIGRLVLRADLRAAGINDSDIGESLTAMEGTMMAVKEKPRLVIIGSALRDIPGLELIRQLRNTPALAKVKFCVLSAVREKKFRKTALEIAEFFLPKPFSAREVKKIVEQSGL